MRTLSKPLFFLISLLFCIPLHAAPVNLPPSAIQSNSLSVEQLQQAAEAGDPDAQYALGYMYYNGKNVSPDTQMGLNWIKRASVQGQEQAIEAMRLLAPAKMESKRVSQTTTSLSSEESDANISGPDESPAPASQKTPPAKTRMATTNEDKPTTAILSAPGSYFTIQLLLTANKIELDRYIRTHALGNQANYYPTKKHGYVLLYGAYKTRTEAQASLLKLPAAVKAQKPWIKQISQVKGSVK